jgi:cell division protein FtsI (penicillin-binding protein 3)
MSENVKHTILRFAIIFGVILMLFIAVFARIISLQYIHRKQLESMVVQRDSVQKPIRAVRGNIFDCHGKPLASSVPQYSIHMDTRVETLHQNDGEVFYQYLDSIAEGLSRIIGDQTPQEYRNKILEAYKAPNEKDRTIRLTPKRVTYTQLQLINQLPLINKGKFKSGFFVNDLNIRIKPFKSLGSRTIGSIYAESGKGNSGLELQFDSYLQGKDGMSVRQRLANEWGYIPIEDAKNGYDIHTTLDVELLEICEKHLRLQLDTNQAEWGCVILMEVKTGEIKAMCNLDRGSDGTYYEMANHAVKRVEPGSTFKTLSIMAALDDGKIKMEDTVEVTTKGWKYYGKLHRDAHAANTTYDIKGAIETSSNIALARIITKHYNHNAELFINKLKSMHLYDSVNYMIPGADQARIEIPKDKVSLSNMSYGYYVEFSPLQMLTFYNAIANNGQMITPVIAKSIKDGDNIIEEYSTHVLTPSICNTQTLRNIRECLHEVVWGKHGTAKSARSEKVKIAGKTGTNQLYDEKTKKYIKDRYRISFVGYFPEENPQYTCICVIQRPIRTRAGSGTECGAVVRRIAEEVMIHTNEYVIRDGKLVLQPKN